jgi:hypothetical protein
MAFLCGNLPYRRLFGNGALYPVNHTRKPSTCVPISRTYRAKWRRIANIGKPLKLPRPWRLAPYPG